MNAGRTQVVPAGRKLDGMADKELQQHRVTFYVGNVNMFEEIEGNLQRTFGPSSGWI